MRLMARIIMAIVVTVLAALVLYFVFLHGQRPAHGEGQSMTCCEGKWRPRA